MAETTFELPGTQHRLSRRIGDIGFEPRLLARKLMMIGVLFLFSGTHNVLTILAPGAAAPDPNASPDVTVGGVAESDAIPGPLKVVVWCVVGMAMAASQAGRILRLAARSPLLTGLAVLGLASTLWSDNPAESWSHGLSLLLTTLVAFFFCVEYEPQAQMEILVAIGWLAALASIYVAIFLPEFGVDQVYNLGEWRGIFAQKNACAAAMLLFLTPLFSSKGKALSLASGAYCLTVLFVLAKTQSRNGWIVAVALVFTMVGVRWLAQFRAKDRLALFAMTLWFVGAASLTLGAASATLLPMLGRDATFTGRKGIWDTALAAIAERPLLGYGFRAFWTGPNARSVVMYGVAAIKHAHNGLLELWLGVGLFGVLMFLFSLFVAVRDIATCLRPGRPGYVDWYVGTILAVVYFSVAEPFLVMDRSLSWVLYVVACVGLHRQAELERENKRRSLGAPQLDLGAQPIYAAASQ